jgi:hypothetical protein
MPLRRVEESWRVQFFEDEERISCTKHFLMLLLPIPSLSAAKMLRCFFCENEDALQEIGDAIVDAAEAVAREVT